MTTQKSDDRDHWAPQSIDPVPPDENKSREQYGHPRFYAILEELADLHSAKNYDYAIGGDPLGNFHRVSEFFARYPNLDLNDPRVVTMVYLMKQIDAVMWMLSNKHTAKVQGIADRLVDVAVYSIINMIHDENTSPPAETS